MNIHTHTYIFIYIYINKINKVFGFKKENLTTFFPVLTLIFSLNAEKLGNLETVWKGSLLPRFSLLCSKVFGSSLLQLRPKIPSGLGKHCFLSLHRRNLIKRAKEERGKKFTLFLKDFFPISW